MKHNRHSIRLRSWDYSSGGFYFVTICTYQRECLFGSINNSKVSLTNHGQVVLGVLESLPNRFPVEIDVSQVMPNHVHFIIEIVGAIHESPNNGNRAHRDAPLRKRRQLLPQIIGYFKMNTSKVIHKTNPNLQVWQRNFYEHIIRNETELEKIRKYITDNPLRWDEDRNNPENLKLGS